MPLDDSSTPWLRFSCEERIGSHTATYDLTLFQSWTCIFGPSGSGKTTLLRLLAGLTPQHTGSCRLYGRELRSLPANRRRIALVEQSPALFPNLNVERNVSFGQRANRQHEAIDQVLSDFRLTAVRGAAVHTLSGGERQRVAIARALCSEPQVLLLDEVFTGMDATLRTELTAVLRHYQERMKTPVLSVTHDIGEVFATANEVLRMHDGRIVAQGSPIEVLQAERDDLLQRLQPASD